MNGQEFYEKFFEYLGDADLTEINADDTGMDEYHLRKHIEYAAKKAAGLDTTDN
jgi:hypothetical protein